MLLLLLMYHHHLLLLLLRVLYALQRVGDHLFRIYEIKRNVNINVLYM